MTTSTSSSRHPYEALTPDVVMDALASIGLMADGRLIALSSYENRVYQIYLEDGSVVVAKFYRPERWSDEAILEEHSFARELMDDEIPMVGPMPIDGTTLHHHAGFSFSVSPRRGGRAPELDDFEVLEWVGRFLARIHSIGSRSKFAHRPALDLRTFGFESRDWLLANDIIPLDVQTAWKAACDEAFSIIADTRLGDKKSGGIRLHGDCHPGNILWTPVEMPNGGPHFVDLDDARTGYAVQDLWMLQNGDRAQRSMQLSALVEGYEQFREFDRRELELIEPIRTLRLVHYSAWLARRWDDPSFPANFPWFGSSDYWQGQVQMLVEQIEQMREPPLMV